MEIIFKQFHELELVELYALLKLRTDVFVVEQNCPYPELDDRDQAAIHAMAMNNGALIGYARLFGPGDYFDDHAAIGRILTAKSHRGSGSGRTLVEQCIQEVYRGFGNQTTIRIAAQTYLKEFYESLGFRVVGNEFTEDGIPHVYMLL